jgi:uncharacterized protein YjbI with pentapeptide repeats
VLAMLVAGSALLSPVACLAAATGPGSAATDELTQRKLKAEIAQLEHDNAIADGKSGLIARFAPLATILLSAGGLVLAIFKQGADQRAQRAKDLAEQRAQRDKELVERQREREDRRIEEAHRLEDRFAAILGQLGSGTPAVQAGAAASLVTYLQPDHSRFHHQARLAILTNLKLELAEPIRKLLALVYAKSLESGEPVDHFERDLSRAQLAETSLCDVTLCEADLAFANLRNAVLLGSDLFRARGLEVDLEGARLGAGAARAASLIEVRFQGAHCRGADFSGVRLINAHLQEADLREARFYGASLQAAHLERADLRGAHFQQADIADTYFLEATIDDAALRTLARTRNRDKAHFDPAVRVRLDAL